MGKIVHVVASCKSLSCIHFLMFLVLFDQTGVRMNVCAMQTLITLTIIEYLIALQR